MGACEQSAAYDHLHHRPGATPRPSKICLSFGRPLTTVPRELAFAQATPNFFHTFECFVGMTF